jgi:SAM-dependent methyltransferase
MSLSSFEREVDGYFTRATPRYYLQGWDPDHLHFGLFDPGRNPVYETDLEAVLADRGPAVAAMTERILGQADIRPGQRVVDAGCGVGGTAILLARLGCRVTGVNFNQLQLEIARKTALEGGLDADFAWANCSEALPFADSSVDVVVNIESACHYADRPRFLSEVSRILKPGGQLAASDWVSKDQLTGEESGRLDAMCRVWHLAPPLESLESYRRLLEKVGLTMKSSTRLGEEARANGLIMKHGWSRSRGFPTFLLDAEKREQLDQARTFADTFLPGILGLGLYSAIKPA